VARVYDGTVAMVGWHAALRPLAEGLAADGATVLEVGCGSGWLAGTLAARGVRYVGMDRSHAMLARARSRSAAPLVQGDVTANPFPDKAFDIVLCSGTLGLLRRPQRAVALREMARIARREVRMLEPFSVPGRRSPRIRARAIALAVDGPLTLDDLRNAGLKVDAVGHGWLLGSYTAILARPSGDGDVRP
jgi:ubiquinone/menaquinone biosynthesis C-methylase UbiE